MRKQYLAKKSDIKNGYDEICEAIESSAKSIRDFLQAIEPHSNRFHSSLTKPGIKSGSINDLSEMMERARKLEAAIEESSKKFSAKMRNSTSKYDKYYAVRIKTKTGYIKSEVTESKLRAASNLKMQRNQREAIKSFQTNSPQVFATKFGITDKIGFDLDKFLGTTDKKLAQVSKLYTNMHRSLSECAHDLEESLKSAYQMLYSIKPNALADFSASAEDLKSLNNNISVHFLSMIKDLQAVRSRIDQQVVTINVAAHQAGENFQLEGIGGY